MKTHQIEFRSPQVSQSSSISSMYGVANTDDIHRPDRLPPMKLVVRERNKEGQTAGEGPGLDLTVTGKVASPCQKKGRSQGRQGSRTRRIKELKGTLDSLEEKKIPEVPPHQKKSFLRQRTEEISGSTRNLGIRRGSTSDSKGE